MKIGSIIQWTSNTIPDGFLLCDGTAVSRTTYADLFSVIGTTYGTGDGTTTFNLPDYRGRVAVGKSSDTEFDTLGETGGEKTHTLTVQELASHNHNGTTAWAGEHAHTFNGYAPNRMATGNSDYAFVANAQSHTDVIDSSGSHQHTFTTNNTGGNQPHNNVQPYLVTNYIIKALNPDSIKISELESASSITSSDVFAIVQNGETKKVTTETLLSDVYDTIEDVYSTTETKTNKVWIDGKPIYRKVINSTKANIQSLINNLNIDTPIRFDGLADSKYGYAWAENTRYTDESGYSNVYHWSQSKPRIISWQFENYYEDNNPVMVILEYTKTTD